jgi:hypothetical protein
VDKAIVLAFQGQRNGVEQFALAESLADLRSYATLAERLELGQKRIQRN